MIERVYKKHLEGKRVYPLWRLDKNISWYNFFTYPIGLIHGVITLEWTRKKDRYMLWRLKPWNIWLPPTYAKGYYVERMKGR